MEKHISDTPTMRWEIDYLHSPSIAYVILTYMYAKPDHHVSAPGVST